MVSRILAYQPKDSEIYWDRCRRDKLVILRLWSFGAAAEALRYIE